MMLRKTFYGLITDIMFHECSMYDITCIALILFQHL